MQIAMTAADLLKWIAYGPCTVTKIWGYNPEGTDDLYIQLHQTPPLADGTLTAATVPAVKSLVAQASFVFSYGPKDFGEGLALSELLLAISTTEANYTAPAAGHGLDMFVEVSGAFLCDGTEVVTGDLSTGVDTQQPWTDSVLNVGYKLLRIDYTNKSGAAAWLMGFADDAGTDGDKPDLVVTSKRVPPAGTVPAGVPNNAAVTCFYGSEGAKMFSLDTSHSPHYGLMLWESSTGDELTYTSTGASYIRTIHRP